MFNFQNRKITFTLLYSNFYILHSFILQPSETNFQIGDTIRSQRLFT